MTMRGCGHIDLDALARALAPARRADIAAGVLLAAELLAELPTFDRHSAWTALRDVAATIHPEAGDELLAALLSSPDGEHNIDDRQVCQMCHGQPRHVITAVHALIGHMRAELRRKDTTPT